MADYPTPQQAERNYDAARELLRPEKASRLTAVSNPAWRRDDLICIWYNINEKQYGICLEYISLYCDVSNGLNQRRWVQDPQIFDTIYPGRYRLVDVSYDRNRPNNPGIIRRLRKGFATEIHWDEAFILNKHDLQEDERYIVCVLPNWDPSAVDSALEPLRSNPILIDPILENQQYSGTWEIIHIRPEKDEDGCFHVRLLIAQPQYTLNAYTGAKTPEERERIYLWNVPKRTAQALVDSFREAVDASWTANYSTEQGTVDLILTKRVESASITLLNIKTEENCITKEYTDYYYGLTEAEMQGFNLGTPPQGWAYRLTFRYDNNGTYTAIVTRVFQKAKTLDETIITATIGKLDKMTTYIGQTSLPSALQAEAGKIKRIEGLRENEYCKYDWRYIEEIINKLTGAEKEVADGYTETRVIEKDAPSAKNLPDNPITGQIRSVRNMQQPAGTYDTVETTREYNDLTRINTYYNKTPHFTSVGYNIVGKEELVAPPPGYGLLDVRKQENGLYYGLYYESVYNNVYGSWDNNNWENFIKQNLILSYLQFTIQGGVRKRRVVTVYFDVVQCRSGSSAWNYFKYRQFTAPGGPIMVARPLAESRVEAVPPHGYRVWRINKMTFTQWQNDMPGAGGDIWEVIEEI